ncbi:hypothetical protein HZA55_07065 [Candidatus Poribacteria bacterium]|nr:hypothetical protein [Candidatus Poribacteria bacterium]
MSDKTITIEDAPFCCPLATGYVKKHNITPAKIPVISCDGACLRGEIARRAANNLTFKLAPERTVRICFQGIVGGGCEERVLVEKADKVLFVEGCAMRCGSRLVKGAMEIKAKAEIVFADQLFAFNPNLFGIDEMQEKEIKAHAETVANLLFTKSI